MKNNIYLTGGWGYGNRGDNAILAGMLQTFDESDLIKGGEVIITSYESKETKKHNNVISIDSIHKILTRKRILNFWTRLSFWIWQKSAHNLLLSKALSKHIEILRTSKVLVMGGGGYFNDDWPDMLLSKYAEIELAKFAGCPVVMYGQTIGPFSEATIKNSLSQMLQDVSAIAYRDAQSIEVLKKCNIGDDKSLLTADEANLLKIKNTGVFAKQKKKVIIGVMFQFYRPHLNPFGVKGDTSIKNNIQYVEEVLKAINQIVKNINCHLVFITSTEWDIKVNKKIYENTIVNNNSSKEYLEELTSDLFIEACQQVDLMISTNMHPVILAATASKPSVAISYHYKLDDYMASIGLQEYILRIDNFTANELISKVEQALKVRDALCLKVKRQSLSCKEHGQEKF